MFSFRNHADQPANHDPETSEVRESAQRVGHDEPATDGQCLRRQGGHIQVGNQFVKDRLGAQQGAGNGCFRPRHASQPGQWRHHNAKHALQGPRLPVVGNQRDQAVRQSH